MALSLSVQSKGNWVVVPQQLHQPLDQGMGIIKGTKAEQAARAFSDFVNGPKGREIMKKYGFSFP